MSAPLAEFRKKAEENFQTLPWPSAKDEAYRFFPALEWKEAPPAQVSKSETNPAGPANDDGVLIQLSDGSCRVEGKEIVQWRAMKDMPSLEFTQESEVLADDKFAQLSMARFKDGVLVRLEKNTAKPVRILQSYSQSQEITFNQIQVAPGVEANLVLECRGSEDERQFSELHQVTVGEGAKLTFSLVHSAGKKSNGFQRIFFRLEKHSQVQFLPLYLGAQSLQSRVVVDLVGEGACADVLGAVSGANQETTDLWYDLNHAASLSKSNMNFNFVMNDKSRATLNGLIHVNRSTVGVESNQKVKSLLLNKGASVNAIPKLIIQTDEVKCGHGASVSSIHPDQLHYLRCRGIPEEKGRALIVAGYFEPILSALPGTELRVRSAASIAALAGVDDE